MRSRGSNQYQCKHRSDHRRDQIFTIILVIAIAIFVVVLGRVSRRSEKHASFPIIQAYASVYHQPELAPLPEREANIALIKKIWGKDAPTGLAISKCESGYREHAYHHNSDGSIDEGVFQINSIHAMPDMQNSTANISYAYVMFKEQGLSPWASSRGCWSL